MDIYSDRVHIASMRNIRWYRAGHFMSRLVGINIVQKDDQVNVEPVYLPVIAVDREGNLTFVTLSWNKPKFLIVLLPYRPFVHIERTDVINLEDE
jgi:hypothetical protein